MPTTPINHRLDATLLIKYAILFRRLCRANYPFDILANFQISDQTAERLDALEGASAAHANGIISENSNWDNTLRAVVRLRDVGLSLRAVEPLVGLLQYSREHAALLGEALLVSQISVFAKWVCILEPGLWCRAQTDCNIHVLFNVGLITGPEPAICFQYHAAHIAWALNAQLQQAAAEGAP